MITTLTVLSAIKNKLDNLSINSYLNLAPQKANYPFVVFSVISTPVEYTFTNVMENIRIQFSIFDNNSDQTNLLNIAVSVETAFEEFQLGNTIYCTHKDAEVGPIYMEHEHYWMITMDHIFLTDRSKV